MNSIRYLLVSISLIFLVGSTTKSFAQFAVKLQSVSGAGSQTSSFLKFGSVANVEILCIIDAPHSSQEALNYLKNYYLVVNGIPYSNDLKIQNMSLLSVKNKGTEGAKTTYQITYQTKIPGATKEVNGKTILSEFWHQHFKPLYNEVPLKFTLLSVKPEDQAEPAYWDIGFRYYEQWREYLFIVLFGALLTGVLLYGGKRKFTFLRDEIQNSSPTCSDPAKQPFSLSKVQVFVWTFIIFGLFAYIWAVVDFLPVLAASHLVLLGIAAGQRIISQMIDAQNPPLKNSRNNLATQDGCSEGFFTDLISDKSGLSITRLQYLIVTFIFLVVFITTAIQKLELTDFYPMQLALMGTSAGLQLWEKQLVQKK